MGASRPSSNRLRASAVDWTAVGLRRTPQREVVLSLVRSCDEHPTAEWIHRQARKQIADISLATIYRTLRILKEKGLIWEFSGGANPSRYDGQHDTAEHVRCVACGVVNDLDIPEVRNLRQDVSDRTGWSIGRTPLVFHGYCPACARQVAANGNGAASDAKNGDAPPNGRTNDNDRDLAEGYW